MRISTMYEIEILSPAWADIERIGDIHFALSGPQSALKVTNGILDSIDTLQTFPHGYPPVPDAELAAEGFRMVIYKNYLAIYKVNGDKVSVYHVADGRTNYPQLFRNLD